MENNLIQQPNSTASPKEAPIKLTRGMIFTLSTLLGMRYSSGASRLTVILMRSRSRKKLLPFWPAKV